MRAVNLLQDDRRRRDAGDGPVTTSRVLIGGAAVLAVVVVCIGFMSVQGRSSVSDKRETLASIQQQVAEAEAARLAALAASPTDEQAQLSAFKTAAYARISWDKLLGDIAKVLPAGSWVSNLTMHQPTTVAAAPVQTDPNSLSTTVTTNGLDPTATPVAPVGDPTTFVISGVALTHDLVARVMDRLELVPMLSDVSLQSSRRADIGGQKAYSFSMNAILSSTGEDQ